MSATVPRVAESIEDLRVGQIVACLWRGQQGIFDVTVVGERGVEGLDRCTKLVNRNWMFGPDGAGDGRFDVFADRGLVILADAPAAPVTVPAEAVERLREALAGHSKIRQPKCVAFDAASAFLAAIDGAGE